MEWTLKAFLDHSLPYQFEVFCYALSKAISHNHSRLFPKSYYSVKGLVKSTPSTKTIELSYKFKGKDSKLTFATIGPSVLKVRISPIPSSPKSNSASLFWVTPFQLGKKLNSLQDRIVSMSSYNLKCLKSKNSERTSFGGVSLAEYAVRKIASELIKRVHEGQLYDETAFHGNIPLRSCLHSMPQHQFSTLLLHPEGAAIRLKIPRWLGRFLVRSTSDILTLIRWLSRVLDMNGYISILRVHDEALRGRTEWRCDIGGIVGIDWDVGLERPGSYQVATKCCGVHGDGGFAGFVG